MRARPLKFYEFFAGAGLVRLALEPRWKCVWANDFDPRKAEIYRRNFGSGELHLADVGAASANNLPTPADMAWASFPCQDLSLAGWRKGMSARRSGTFWAFWRIMRELFESGRRPPVIAIENVVGLLYGQSFTGLCEALSAIGMQYGAMVIDANRFLPHSRPRVFIVAVDSRLDCSGFVDPNPLKSPWFTAAVRSAHSSLPPSLKEQWRWWALPQPPKNQIQASDLIEDEPTGTEWHSEAETQKLLDMMTIYNIAKVDAEKEKGGFSVGMLYKRTRGGAQRAEVRFDGIAGCLRTPQGGSSRQTVLVIRDEEVRSRLLSPREAARLMGVSDTYWLPRDYNAGYRAMGDGVAVPVVSWLAKHLLTPLAQLSAANIGLFSAEQTPAQGEATALSLMSAQTLATEWETARQ